MIKLPIYKIILSSLLGTLLLMQANSVLAVGIEWKSYSNSIFTLAKNEKKLVLIYVKSDTCSWCERMNSEVFTSPEIVSLISKKFIPVTVDITTQKPIADQYGAFGTPTFVILDADKHQISNLVGFQSEQDFKTFLEAF